MTESLAGTLFEKILLQKSLCMEKPFLIEFDYPFAEAHLSIRMEAVATLHHSDPYYVVNQFHIINSPPQNREALPEVKIQVVTLNGKRIWVHCDSKKPTLLSERIGKSIDELR